MVERIQLNRTELYFVRCDIYHCEEAFQHKSFEPLRDHEIREVAGKKGWTYTHDLDQVWNSKAKDYCPRCYIRILRREIAQLDQAAAILTKLSFSDTLGEQVDERTRVYDFEDER